MHFLGWSKLSQGTCGEIFATDETKEYRRHKNNQNAYAYSV